MYLGLGLFGPAGLLRQGLPNWIENPIMIMLFGGLSVLGIVLLRDSRCLIAASRSLTLNRFLRLRSTS
jgi:xanthine/uracil permease